MTLAELEREAIERALAEHDNNKTRAARSLGINIRTLQRKLARQPAILHDSPSGAHNTANGARAGN